MRPAGAAVGKGVRAMQRDRVHHEHSTNAWAAAALLLLLAALPPARARALPAWPVYAGNPQHTALSPVATQPLVRIAWQTPMDLQPQYDGDILFIHYGTPLITAGNTVIVPVKTGVADSFRVEARRGTDGTLLWQLDSDYQLPPHNWTPGFGAAVTPGGRMYMPAAGGTLLYTNLLDSPGAH